MNFELLKSQATVALTLYGGKVLLAIAVFVVGRFLIGQFTRFFSHQMMKRGFDKDVQPFLISLASVSLNVALLISIAGILGLETTSFIAILGAAGLAIGLALQGSLANFAGGVLILIFRPYRIGDLITAQGFTGNVEEIRVFDTTLVTPDNKTIIIPNSAISSGPVTNISGKGRIRVDAVFAAGAQNGVDAIRSSILKVVEQCPTALDEKHDILVTKLTENAIFFDVRVWTKSEHYWDTYYFIHEHISKQFAYDNISAPKPGELSVNVNRL